MKYLLVTLTVFVSLIGVSAHANSDEIANANCISEQLIFVYYFSDYMDCYRFAFQFRDIDAAKEACEDGIGSVARDASQMWGQCLDEQYRQMN